MLINYPIEVDVVDLKTGTRRISRTTAIAQTKLSPRTFDNRLAVLRDYLLDFDHEKYSKVFTDEQLKCILIFEQWITARYGDVRAAIKDLSKEPGLFWKEVKNNANR